VRNRRRGRDGQPDVVAVASFGPEPIGADQVDALQAGQAAHLSGAADLVAPGLVGYDSGDGSGASSALFQSPQNFAGQAWAMTSPIVNAEAPGVAGAAEDGTPLPPAWTQ